MKEKKAKLNFRDYSRDHNKIKPCLKSLKNRKNVNMCI